MYPGRNLLLFTVIVYCLFAIVYSLPAIGLCLVHACLLRDSISFVASLTTIVLIATPYSNIFSVVPRLLDWGTF